MKLVVSIRPGGRPVGEVHTPDGVVSHDMASAEFWRLLVREVSSIIVMEGDRQVGSYDDIDEAFRHVLEIQRKAMKA